MHHKSNCQCASCVSTRKAKAFRDARNANLAVKREALERMQGVYSRFKNVTDLERIGQRMQGYAGIVRSSLAIALYGAPIVVLTALTVKAIFWILF